MKQKGWISVALVNLVIVASLGLLLRSKLLFSMPFLDFKNTLHAHSHFAFSGWISLALLSLMVFQILPDRLSGKKVYQWLLWSLLVCAVGMLVSFPFQGYGLYSIVFSTLFIFFTYAFTFIFLKDFRTVQVSKSVKLLTISCLVCLVVSSCGPFTLAYMLAAKIHNVILYKNAIYTYLHLQYSGFFTLAVFALSFNRLQLADNSTRWFSRLLTASVVPSMFASYLWSYPGVLISIIAVAGSVISLMAAGSFVAMAMRVWKSICPSVAPVVKGVGAVSMTAFLIKMVLQALTIIPVVGDHVFANRPIIIGFLHLVLLGFISIYLLAYFLHAGILAQSRYTAFAVWLFISGVAFNEVVLMGQGLGAMFMMSSTLTQWLLFAAAGCLFTGACLIALSNFKKSFTISIYTKDTNKFRTFSQS